MKKRNKMFYTGVAIGLLAVMTIENTVCLQASVNDNVVIDTTTDTDGDGYSDYLEETVYGTDPTVSDVSFYRWNQEYLKIDYAGNERWKNYDGTTISFGGSQMWFYDDTSTEEPDKNARDYIIQNFGCGLITSSDVLLYLAKQDSRYATARTDKVLQDENGVIDYQSYVDYIYGMDKSYERVINNFGMLLSSMHAGMGAYNMCNRLGLNITWSHSKIKMLSRMKEMLENDIPVPLCISSNDRGGEGGVYFYDWLPTENEPYHFATKRYPYAVEGHFVTVTGLMVDNVKNQTILEISSWGRKYYVNYDEFIKYVEKHSTFASSNIVYIRK